MTILRRQAILVLGYLTSILFTLGVTIVPAHGYHPNIYRAVPVFVWVLFIVGLVAGFISSYSAIQAQSHKEFSQSVLLIGVLYLVFWFYPLNIGLRFWTAPRGDLLMHFGRGSEIVQTGAIPAIDIYPLAHIFLAELNLVSGIRMGVFGPLTSLLYYGTLIAGVGLVARRYANTTVAQYVLLASLPLVFNKYTHSFMPWVLTFSLIPLVFLFASIRQNRDTQLQRAGVVLGALVVIWFIVIGHPMTGLVTVAVIVGYYLIRGFASKWVGESDIPHSPVTWYMITLLGFPFWYLSRGGFSTKIATIAIALTGASSGEATQKITRAGSSGYGLKGLVEYAIGHWGTLILYLGVAGVIWTFAAYRVSRRYASPGETIVAAMFGFGASVGAFLLAGSFITGNPYRVNQITVVISFFVIGGAFYWLSERDGKFKYQATSVVLLLAVVGAGI